MKANTYRRTVLYGKLYLLAGTLFVLLTSSPGIAQNQSIDSLLQALDSLPEDTHRVQALNTLAKEYRETNLEQSKAYAEKALQLSTTLSYENGMILAMKNSAVTLQLQGKHDEAFAEATKALQIATQSGNGEKQVFMLHVICYICGIQGDYDRALRYCNRAMEKNQDLQHQDLEANIKQSIGVIYKNKGDYDRAIAYYMEALEIREQSGTGKPDISVLNNLGVIYSIQKRYDKALEYYLRALEFGKSVMGAKGLAELYNNIGIIYRNEGDHKKALGYYSQALLLYEKVGHKKGLAIVHNNLGMAYKGLGKIEKALEHLFQAVDTYKSIDNKSALANSLNNIARIYTTQQYYEKARHYVEEAIDIAMETGRKRIIAEVYQQSSYIYFELKNYERALLHFQYYERYKSQLFNEASDKRLAKMQARYETVEKERQLWESKYETAEKERQIVTLLKDKQQLYASLIGVVFMMAFLLILFINYRQKQKLKSIRNTLKGQETERKRISKELHDGVGGALASIRLNLMRMDEKKETQLDHAIENISKTWEEVRAISHHLMPPALIDDSFVFALKKYVDDLITATGLEIQLDCFPEEKWNNLEKDLQTELYRMVQEVCNNIVKHAQASRVFIQLVWHHKGLTLLLEDDGLGFDVENKKGGIGLKNIRSRVRLLKGRFHIESQYNKGTAVHIEIPEPERVAVL